MPGENDLHKQSGTRRLHTHVQGTVVALVLWAAAWAITAVRLVTEEGELSGPIGVMVAGLLVVLLPATAATLVGWSRQRGAPIEPESGPDTVHHAALTAGLAAAAAAGLVVLHLAVFILISAVQADQASSGRDETWWEPLVLLILGGIYGSVLGLLGAPLGGLLATIRRRTHRDEGPRPPVALEVPGRGNAR